MGEDLGIVVPAGGVVPGIDCEVEKLLGSCPVLNSKDGQPNLVQEINRDSDQWVTSRKNLETNYHDDRSLESIASALAQRSIDASDKDATECGSFFDKMRMKAG